MNFCFEVRIWDLRMLKQTHAVLPRHLANEPDVSPCNVAFNPAGVLLITYQNEATYAFMETPRNLSSDLIARATIDEDYRGRAELLMNRASLGDILLAKSDQEKARGDPITVHSSISELCPDGFVAEPFVRFSAHCNYHTDLKQASCAGSRVFCPSDCGGVFVYLEDGSLETVLCGPGGHADSLNSVSISSARGEVITAGCDDFILLWRSVALAEKVDPGPHFQRNYSLAMSDAWDMYEINPYVTWPLATTLNNDIDYSGGSSDSGSHEDADDQERQ
eukprot:GEMP01021809.1.p1 GENE.GEMP01021809.1~~GEMP01021809.1.p1  ORF type:complete len:277 (+),score=46.95 GEMP01021809.1:764-1594(+)